MVNGISDAWKPSTHEAAPFNPRRPVFNAAGEARGLVLTFNNKIRPAAATETRDNCADIASVESPGSAVTPGSGRRGRRPEEGPDGAACVHRTAATAKRAVV